MRHRLRMDHGRGWASTAKTRSSPPSAETVCATGHRPPWLLCPPAESTGGDAWRCCSSQTALRALAPPTAWRSRLRLRARLPIGAAAHMWPMAVRPFATALWSQSQSMAVSVRSWTTVRRDRERASQVHATQVPQHLRRGCPHLNHALRRQMAIQARRQLQWPHDRAQSRPRASSRGRMASQSRSFSSTVHLTLSASHTWMATVLKCP